MVNGVRERERAGVGKHKTIKLHYGLMFFHENIL